MKFSFLKKSLSTVLCLTVLFASFPIEVFGQFEAGASGSTGFEAGADGRPEQGPTVQVNGQNQNIDSGSDSNFEAGASGSTGFEAGAGIESPDDPSKGNVIPVTSNKEKTSEEQKAAQEALACSVSTLLANALTAAIYSGIGSLLGSVTGSLDERVPSNVVTTETKEVGLTVFGIPVLPSWDSIGYCLANAMIVYIADSTIAWIQSGFEGKPAFVDDPGKLFSDIADYEMSTFLETLGGGFLCEPFEPYVISSLVKNYGPSYSNSGRCTLDTVGANFDSLVGGQQFDYQSWFQVTQNPANNPRGSYLLAEDEARNRILAGIGPVQMELDWGKGYFSWKAKDGPNAGKTVSPGQAIEAQISERLNLDTKRLVLAEKFDQVVSALVNYLVKTALEETLGTIRN